MHGNYCGRRGAAGSGQGRGHRALPRPATASLAPPHKTLLCLLLHPPAPQVGDLAVASPATVSRCGMVYLEPAQLGWQPLLTSWLQTLPKALGHKALAHTEALLAWLLPPCLRFVRRSVAEVSPTQDTALAVGVMRLMAALVTDALGVGGGPWGYL